MQQKSAFPPKKNYGVFVVRDNFVGWFRPDELQQAVLLQRGLHPGAVQLPPHPGGAAPGEGDSLDQQSVTQDSPDSPEEVTPKKRSKYA